MKKDLSLSESILLVLMVLATSPLLSLYGIRVIKDVVKLYNVPVNLNTHQLFGVLIIISILRYSSGIKSDNDRSIWRTYFTYLLESLFFISSTWGMSYVYSYFI